jgi:hypothetical protein
MVNVPWVLAAVLAGVWLLVAIFELGDVATVFLDSRTARDRDVPGRIARERVNELFWVIPIVALLALGIGVGVDHAGRYFFDTRNPALGSLLLLGIAVLIVAVAGLTVAAVAATDRVSYAALRRELREHEGQRLTPTQLADFRATLARVDARTRSRMRPTRLLLTAPSVLRLVPVVLGLLLVTAVSVALGLAPGDADPSFVVVSALAPVLSFLFAVLGIRFSVTSDTAWRRVYAKQRVDILKLLETFDRSSRKGVAGLGDRVARALKILSEQQPS